MKTYILNQNGKLIMKEKVSKFIQKTKQSNPLLLQNIQIKQFPQKSRSLVEPPLTEQLKNTHISHPSISSSQSRSASQQHHSPVQSGGKKIKVSELQLDLFSKLCKIININSTNPIGNDIPFDKLQDDNVIRKLYDIQDKLKDVFPSSKLTSLHTNALKKQSFPGVNIVRQIFKQMGYKLRPINTSEGYVGSKKILRRVYHIEKL